MRTAVGSSAREGENPGILISVSYAQGPEHRGPTNWFLKRDDLVSVRVILNGVGSHRSDAMVADGFWLPADGASAILVGLRRRKASRTKQRYGSGKAAALTCARGPTTAEPFIASWQPQAAVVASGRYGNHRDGPGKQTVCAVGCTAQGLQMCYILRCAEHTIPCVREGVFKCILNMGMESRWYPETIQLPCARLGFMSKHLELARACCREQYHELDRCSSNA